MFVIVVFTITHLRYLQCSTHLCSGTAKISRNVVIEGEDHSPHCSPSDIVPLIISFKRSIKNILKRQWRRLRELFDEQANKPE